MVLKSGTDWRINTEMRHTSAIHHYNWMSSGGTGSPFPLEKRNVVYVLCGKRSGSKANQTIQSMLSSASLSTPSVAACGATTVWANGPIAPPYFRVYSMLSLTICSLDMLVMKIGMLLDSIIKPKGEENVEQTSTERIKIS